MRKRILSLVLTVAMIVGMVQTMALAVYTEADFTLTNTSTKLTINILPDTRAGGEIIGSIKPRISLTPVVTDYASNALDWVVIKVDDNMIDGSITSNQAVLNTIVISDLPGSVASLEGLSLDVPASGATTNNLTAAVIMEFSIENLTGGSYVAFAWEDSSCDNGAAMAAMYFTMNADGTIAEPATTKAATGIAMNNAPDANNYYKADDTEPTAVNVETANNTNLAGARIAVKWVDTEGNTKWYSGDTANVAHWSANQSAAKWVNADDTTNTTIPVTLPTGLAAQLNLTDDANDGEYTVYGYVTETGKPGVPMDGVNWDVYDGTTNADGLMRALTFTVDTVRPTVTPQGSTVQAAADSTFTLTFGEELSVLLGLGTAGAALDSKNAAAFSGNYGTMSIKHADTELGAATGTALTAGTDYTISYDKTAKTATITFTNALTDNDYYCISIPAAELKDVAGNAYHATDAYSVTAKAISKADISAALSAWANGAANPVIAGVFGTAAAGKYDTAVTYNASAAVIGAPAANDTNILSTTYLQQADLDDIKATLTALGVDSADQVFKPTSTNLTAAFYKDNSNAKGAATDTATDGAAAAGKAPVNAGTYWLTLSVDDTHISGSVDIKFTIAQKELTLPTGVYFAKTYDGDDSTLTHATLTNANGDDLTANAAASELEGTVGGEDGLYISAITAGTFDSANAADCAKFTTTAAGDVTLSAITGAGTASKPANYIFKVGDHAAKIAPKVIPLGAPTFSKTYDGNTSIKDLDEYTDGGTHTGYTIAVTGAGSVGDPHVITVTDTTISNNTVEITALAGTYNSKDAATATSMTLTGATLADGIGKAGNYNVVGTDGITALSSTNSLTLTGTVTEADVTLAVNAAPAAYVSAVSGGVKLSTLLTATGLVGTETLADYDADFDTVLTRNDNGTVGNVTDDTWTVTVNGQTFTVVFYASDATNPGTDSAKILAEDATFKAGSYPFTLALGTAVGDSGNYTSDETFVAGTTTMDGILTVSPDYVPPSGGGVSSYTVKYDVGTHGKLAEGAKASESVNYNKSPKSVPEVVANEGWKFLGWSLDGKTVVDPTGQKITKSTTFTALYEDASHAPYIIGIGDGRFAPVGQMTRAEAVTMLARLHPDWKGVGAENVFNDVADDAWYAPYVTFATAKGITEGVGDDLFAPERAITRGEMAALLVRYMGLNTDGLSGGFTDTLGNWADRYVTALKNAGIADGYGDGTFKPDAGINRSEAVKLINGAVGRAPDKELVKLNTKTNPFIDVPESHWAFADVMEAALEHHISDYHTQSDK